MQLGDEIIKVLEYLCEKIGVTIDWTSNNVMSFLEQICEKYIKWEISTSIVWLVIYSMCLIVGSCFIKSAINEWRKYRTGEQGYHEVISIIYWCLVAIILSIAVPRFFMEVFDIIECMAFPEKTIYDAISYQISLMNSR